MAEPSDPNAGGAPATPNNPITTSTPTAGAPAVDVQAQINAALAQQQADFAKQLKEATGHSDLKALTEAQLEKQGMLQELADARKLEADKAKSDLAVVKIENALLAAATDAVNPALVKDLLSSKAVVDAAGNVTVDGKPVADAVKQLLTENPFLAKAQGGTGSGAPQTPAPAAKDKSSLAPLERLKAAHQQSAR